MLYHLNLHPTALLNLALSTGSNTNWFNYQLNTPLTLCFCSHCCCAPQQLTSPLDEQHDSDAGDDEFHDAQPEAAEESSDNASTCSADNTSTRSCPMPISASGHTRTGSGGSEREAAAAAAAAEQQQEAAAAVAKAQRDLLADAAYVQSAAVTDSSQPKLGPQDFEILRVVGQGAFGKVGRIIRDYDSSSSSM
jgi:hypothetical protein